MGLARAAAGAAERDAFSPARIYRTEFFFGAGGAVT